MKFEERKELFQKDLIALMATHKVDVYPANVVMQSGEVMPMIKMADTEEVKEDLMVSEEAPKEDGDKTKK